MLLYSPTFEWARIPQGHGFGICVTSSVVGLVNHKNEVWRGWFHIWILLEWTALTFEHEQLGTLQWRYNEHHSVANHQPYDCLLNRLFRRRTEKTPKLRVTGLCGEKARDAECVSIWQWHRLDWLTVAYILIPYIWQSQAEDQGFYTLSGPMSYRKISWNLEAARFGFRLSNRSEIWHANRPQPALPRCLSNCRAIRSLLHPISGLRDLALRRRPLSEWRPRKRIN